MSGIKSILFVCTGNSCRSVMAEGLMKKCLKDRGRDDVVVRSAGISAIEQLPPTDETIQVMSDEGIDVSNYWSKRVTSAMIDEADIVLVMEEAHKYALKQLNPKAASKIFLLKEYGIRDDSHYPENPEVSDPIGRPIDYYELSLQVIKDQLERIIDLI